MSRVSFSEIFSYLFKFTFILMIPVLKSLISFFSGKTQLANLITYNSALVIILFLWAYLEYRSKFYKIKNDDLYIEKGFLVKQKQNFNLKKVVILYIKNSLVDKIFKTSKIYFVLKNNKKKKIKPELILKKDKVENIFKEKFSKEGLKETYKSKIERALLVAFLWSNPITGLLFFLPLINKIENTIDETLRNKFYSNMNSFIDFIQEAVGLAATGIIRIFLIGWVIAFLIHFLSLMKQKTFQNSKIILVQQGLVNETKVYIDAEKIDFFIFKQTLLMNFLKIYNVYVSVSGNSKKEPVLIGSGLKKQEIKNDIDIFVSENIDEVLKEKVSNISRFLFPSFALSCSVAALVFSKNDLMFLITLFLVFYSIKWIIFEVKTLRRNEISIHKEIIKIKSNKAFSILKIIVKKDRIEKINIVRNKKNKTCNLVIFMSSKKSFRVNNLDTSKTFDLLDKIS